MELKPPLSYQGGKSRISSKIVDVIEEDCNLEGKEYFHDFCSGSGAVSIEIFKRFPHLKVIMYDCSPMGLFYKMVKDGTFLMSEFKSEIEKIPTDLTKIKDYMDFLNKTDFTIYKFLILQASSFGGKQVQYIKTNGEYSFGTNSFRQYWLPTETSSRRSPVNPMMPMPDTLLKNVKNIVENFKPYEVYTGDLNNFINGFEGSTHIFYIDPPYENTSKYTVSLNNNNFYTKFDNIYVSEYKILSNKYWEISSTNKGGISGNSNKNRVEILNKIEKL